MLGFLLQSIQCACCAVMDHLPSLLFDSRLELVTFSGSPSLSGSLNLSTSPYRRSSFAELEASSKVTTSRFPELAEVFRQNSPAINPDEINQLGKLYIHLGTVNSADQVKAFLELLLYGVSFENYAKADLPKILKNLSLSSYLEKIEFLDLSKLTVDLPVELFTFKFMSHAKTIATLTPNGLEDYNTTLWYVDKRATVKTHGV